MIEKEFNVYQERAKKFFLRLGREFFLETIPLQAEYWNCKNPVPFENRLEGQYKSIQEGECWGQDWESGWFHFSATIPEQWQGKDVALYLNLSGEALIFDKDGCPIFGLTNSSIFAENYTKEIFEITNNAVGGSKVDYYVEAAANNFFGMLMDEDPHRKNPKPYGAFSGVAKIMRLGLFNKELWQLRLDVETLLDLCAALPHNDYRTKRIIMAINNAVNLYAENPLNAAKARTALKDILSLPALASAMEVTAVGHAHIDTGWLWPVRETIRKCGRTFASQIALLEKYPDYVFGASQPQHYAFVKKHYPKLYEKIKQYVAQGRWEVQGGMWVEADCNIISGESMVRQFLHGKNFFRDEFGIDVKNLWIPDVFGYSAALPQIIEKSGCDYFLTQKISWSQYNKFPYHTFMWRGIDGTEILTHFPPEDTYNALLSPKEMIPAMDKLSENSFMNEFISLFGIGNGGGGPKEEYVERGLRVRNLEGNPKVKFGRADEFFLKLDKYRDSLPRWVGELYLELHRGTLTTQSRTKRNNRKVEQLLALTEFFCSCLPLEQYPQAELDQAWKTLLINQFHDIIPGSSIGKVYEVTEKEHNDLIALCHKLINESAAKIFTPDQNSMILLNSLSYEYTQPLELPSDWINCEVRDQNNELVKTQEENGKVWALGNIPASSIVCWKKGAPIAKATSKVVDNLILENALVRYEFNRDAQLIAAYDKTVNRSILPENAKANVLSMYIDRPNNWEAWDVDIFYEQQHLEDAVGVRADKIGDGCVRSALEFELKIGDSKIFQTISLANNSKLLEFASDVDWHETRHMLRVSFATNIMANEGSFDIQYGFAKRPTHRNTSWDMAKFEVAAHRYVDLSENDFGVALLNDCKYGHKVLDNTLDICLLRSPLYPDCNADRGKQKFTYALLPHKNIMTQSDVMAQAAMLNRQPEILNHFKGSLQVPCQLKQVGDVSLEVIKKAEKSNDLIVRLVETKGANSSCELQINIPDAKVCKTNLVEWTNDGNIELTNNAVALTLKPFEILTLKISR